MLRVLATAWPLLLGLLLLMVANGLIVTVITVRGLALGFSEGTLGLVHSAYPIGALFGTQAAARLVARVGHVRAFGALAALCSVAAVSHMLTADAISWAALRALAGFGFAGLYVVCESWLNASAENRMRARLLAVYFVTQAGGAAGGSALAGLPDPTGHALFGAAAIFVSLALIPLLVTPGATPPVAAPKRMALGRLIALSPMAVAGAGLNGAAQAAFYIGTPVSGLALGLSAPEATLLLTAGTLVGAAAQFPLGWLSDRTDRRLVVAVAALAGAALAAALGHGPWRAALVGPEPDGLAMMLAVSALAALTLPLYGVCVAHANDRLAPGEIVAASGALVLVMNLGLFLGALAAPALVGHVDAGGAFLAIAAAHVATALVAMLRIGARAAPETGAAAIVYSTQASPVAVAMAEPTEPRGG